MNIHQFLPKCQLIIHGNCQFYGSRIIMKDNNCSKASLCSQYYKQHEVLFNSWKFDLDCPGAPVTRIRSPKAD